MQNRLARSAPAVLALGSFAGAALFGAAAPLARRFFHPPTGGVGALTVIGYPKAYDYFVIAMLVAGAIAGGLAASFMPWTTRHARVERKRPRWVLVAIVTFVVMALVHDHPYAVVEMFHEGEHLTPAFQLRAGERPYRDVFFLHGFATDGGLDALVLGDPPSPRRARRFDTLRNAATLALLAPLAAEVCATSGGVALAVLFSIAAMGAGQVPVFPYFRLAPVLLAALGLLRYARTGRARPLLLAFGASTLGVLWSLDTGMYALAGTAIAFVAIGNKLDAKRLAIVIASALAMPFVILIAARADLHRFFVDSFVIIPRSIDAIWSLPAPTGFTWEAARYYVPPVFFAFVLVLAMRAWRRGDDVARFAVIAILSLVAFRSAMGRCGWSHTRFAVPLLGISLVAFVVEPLVLTKRRIAAVLLLVPIVLYLEVWPNVRDASVFAAKWPARQTHEGLAPYPLRTGKGIYTSPQEATELGALNGFIAGHARPDDTLLDVANERALYYFLERKPAVRCADIAMLSEPSLFAEAMRELEAKPPAVVIVGGDPARDNFDGLPNRKRVPALFAWIDAHYPKRETIGRFVVATRQ